MFKIKKKGRNNNIIFQNIYLNEKIYVEPSIHGNTLTLIFNLNNENISYEDFLKTYESLFIERVIEYFLRRNQIGINKIKFLSISYVNTKENYPEYKIVDLLPIKWKIERP